MPELKKTIENFSLKSSWTSYSFRDTGGIGETNKIFSDPDTGSRVVEVDISSITKGSTILSATLSYRNNGQGNTSAICRSIKKSVDNTGSKDVLNWFSGLSVFDKLSIRYSFTAYGNKGAGSPQGISHYDVCSICDNVLTITYREPYSRCGEPTSVSLAVTWAEPSAGVLLSWSGAKAGTSNPIAGYGIYRSMGGEFTELCRIDSESESASCSVNAPSGPLQSFEFRVVTLGSVSGYDSPQSKAVTLTAAKHSVPPDSVIASPVRYEKGGVIVSWGNSEDFGNFVGYNLERRIGDGNWTRISTETSSTTFVDFPETERGERILYRVQAVDSVYTSEWSLSNEISRNKLPCSPTAVFPCGRIFNADPYIVCVFPEDPDNESVTVYVEIDGTRAVAGSLRSAGGKFTFHWATPLEVGAHTLKVWTMDNMGAESDPVQQNFVIDQIAYIREIHSGDLIFSDQISHVDEVRQMFSFVRELQSSYLMDVVDVPENIGSFAAWGQQMALLQACLNDLILYVNAQAPVWVQARYGMYPNAGVFMQLRRTPLTRGVVP